MPKRFSKKTARALAWLGQILHWGGMAGCALSLFFVDVLAELSKKISIDLFPLAMYLTIASMLIGVALQVFTERYGATYQAGKALLKSYTASFLAIFGVFLLANGIQRLGGSARPNSFGQECGEATCYHPEWIALGAIVLGGGYFLMRSVLENEPD
jgi:hypothetical protein